MPTPHPTPVLPRSLMDWLPPLPYENVQELLDVPGAEPEADLRHSLRDIRLANVIGRGTAVVLRHLAALTRDWPPGQPLTVLDVATGSGDIPLAIARWADRRGLLVHILGTDISPEVIAAAQDHVGAHPAIHLEVGDGRAMPFANGSFDVVTCSLALHHLEYDEGIQLIGEMARVARVGFIVNDVERCWPALLGALLLTRTTPIPNRLTRHDGPASVRRAFTAPEVLAMAEAAGVHGAVLIRDFFWRQALVGRRRGVKRVACCVLRVACCVTTTNH